jgi:hypothetical protein
MISPQVAERKRLYEFLGELFQNGCRQTRHCIQNADGCSAPLPENYKDASTAGKPELTSTAF